MANRTVKDAKSIRGTNPQYLIEKIIRSRIYDSKYWKEECFALTAELLVDKAMELRYVGGVHGGFIYPTPFLCLVLKMLQIQPEKDIVVEFIKNEEFKYVRALGAFYMRLTGTSVDCYKYLEPLYNDNRKLRRQNRQGQFEIVHMDEFIDELLREERLCDVILPRIQKRHILEENNELEPKVSALDDDLDDEMPSDDENPDVEAKENRKDKDNKRDKERRKDRSRERERRDKDRKRERSRSRDRERRREREKEREREKDRERRDRERERERERRERERHEADRRRGRY
ncbi:pre-mRNA-splicing factor 38 [Hyposmocoma kahamanoa]|uniref:pre-mRNA-splicing factor 38 n=1 Tax=Hyposmocoma kahamanoa TaxID=1477025 RepID=UPI000E6D8D31|nr:pre-mRNA-splicing factor 38 [Hyposmocoma kahamanoa]